MPSAPQLLPPSLRVFATSLLGDRSGITEENFTPSELRVLSDAARLAEARGRSYIGYQDYGLTQIPRDQAIWGGLTDPRRAMAGTIGAANFERLPDGSLRFADQYDFASNNQRSDASGRSVPQRMMDAVVDEGVYGLAHYAGELSLPEGSGRNVNITIPKPPFPTSGARRGSAAKSKAETPMPSNYNQMGGVPDFYGALLNDARQNLVRLPDGTLGQAPQRPQPMSVDDLYRGMYPSAPTAPNVSRVTPEGLNVYSRPVVQIDANGQPMVGNSTGAGFATPTMASYRAAEEEGGYLPYTPRQQSGARPAVTIGTQPAGTVQMPPGARPSIVDQMFAGMGPTAQPGMFGRGIPAAPRPPTQTAQASNVWDGFNPNTPKSQDHLPANDGGEAGFLSAFGPQAPANPAVSAITQAAGMPPVPRLRPIPPGQIPLTSLTGTVTPIPPGMVSTGEYLPGSTTPLIRKAVPQAPAAITFKRGDTVSKLAKARGMTVSSFADLYGISNPDRIVAGKTVVPRAPTMPFTPTSAARMPPVYSVRDRQLAEGRNSQIDEFGNIR